MTYVVSAFDATQPTDEKGALQGAEELRALKAALFAKTFFSVTESRFQVVGAATDRQAINNALDACLSARAGGVVWLPGRPTGYNTDQPIVIPRGLNFLGEHPYYSTLRGVGLGAADYVLDINAEAASTVEWTRAGNLCVMSDNNQPVGIHVRNHSNSEFGPFNVRNLSRGMVITGNRNFCNRFKRVIATSTVTNGTVGYLGFTGGGAHSWADCSFGGAYGLFIDSASDIAWLDINSTNFEGCGNNAVRCDGNLWGASFKTPRTEKCAGGTTFLFNPISGKQVAGLSITGGFFETDAETDCIYIGGQPGGSVDGFTILGNTARDYANNFVFMSGPSSAGVIAGNAIIGPANVTNTWSSGVLVFNNDQNSLITTSSLGLKNPSTLNARDYTVTNPATRRTIDVSTATLAELREAVGTLMQDFVEVGFLR
jgi:hypothetical protein